MEQQACEILGYGSKAYYGVNMFQQDIAQPTTKHIILSGWFLIRSYHQNVNINLFQLNESQNSIVVQVGYNLSANKLFLTLQGLQDSNNFVFIAKNTWLYIKTDFIYDSLNQIINVQCRMTHVSQLIFLQKSYSLPLGALSSFLKNSITLSIGSPYIVQSSCAITKQIILYWKEDDSQFGNNSLSDLISDLTSGDTYLYQYLDFYYTSQNNGYLFSVGYNQNPVLLGNTRLDSQEIKEREVIITDYINIDEESGIILNFQAKLQNPSINSETILLQLRNGQDSSFTIKFKNNNQILFNEQLIDNVNLNVWNHFTIVIKYQFYPRFILLIKDYEQQMRVIVLYVKVPLAQLQFGNQLNTQSILVSNIRIYKGNYLTIANNCFLSANQIEGQCIYCNSGYSLDFSNNMTCRAQQSGEIFEIDNIYYSNLSRIQCEKGMINDPANPNNCICIKGFYKNSNNVCTQCPKYCSECTSTFCKTHPSRNNQGQCPSLTFDDGYSCITLDQLIIPQTKNLVDYFYFSNNPNTGISKQISPTKCGGSTNWVNSFYIIQNSILNIYSSTFFMSFAFNFIPNTSISTCVFKYKTQTTQFLIHLIFISGEYFIRFSSTGFSPSLDFRINQNEEVWIGLWVSSVKVAVIINSSGSFNINTKSVAVNTLGSSIELGTNLDPTDTGCISLSVVKPFQLVQNISEPPSLNSLKPLFRSDKEILASFKVDKYYLNYQHFCQNAQKQQRTNIKFLNFPNSLQYFSTIEGFRFTNNNHGAISQFENNSKFALSFYFMIEVNEIHMQTPLISYSMNGFQVRIFLITLFSQYTITLRICFGEDCQDGNFGYFYLNDTIFMLISSKVKYPYSNEIYFQNFDVILNYKKLNYSFVGTYHNLGNKVDDFKIGYFDQNLQPYSYMIYNLNIMEGDGFFYYSYENNNPCFAYMNLSELKCLYLKEDYVYCDNIVKTKNSCLNQILVSQFHYYYHKQTQSYILTDIPKSNCNEIAFDEDFNEIICIDQNSPYTRCLPGYYKDKITYKCIKCSNQCVECQDSSTNCTACPFPSQQFPPSCACLNQSQFKNENLECQYCQQQCNQCVENESLCTVCAEKRINPPFCICDEQKYIEKNNECVEIQCKANCQNCINTPSNCTICSQYRENPPICQCVYGFEEKEDGSCSSCTQNQYYDEENRKCISCSLGCNRCTKLTCLECINPLLLLGNECQCDKGKAKLLVLGQNNQPVINCVDGMDVRVSVEFKQTYYDIYITFSDIIVPIDFTIISFYDLAQITIPVIHSNDYSLSNPIIIKNQIIITLKIMKNISVVTGYLLFLNNEVFTSQSDSQMLKIQYLQQPLSFQVGPFFKTSDNVSTSLDAIAQKVMNQSFMKSSAMNFLNQIQFFFYILNTLQPSSLFLLLKAQYPSHLYKFYQIIGQLLFPFVPEYQSKSQKESFSIFGYNIHRSDIEQTDIQPYKHLGYSSSLLVNIPAILIKYLILSAIYLIIKVITIYCVVNKNNQFIEKIEGFILKRLEGENEINLLSLSICILVQIFDTQQYLWFSRIGFYLAIAISIYLAYYFCKNYQIINKRNVNSQEKNQYQLLTERIQDSSSFCKRNYFLIQYAKKYIIIIIIFFLYDFPIYACSFISFIFLLSSYLTIILKPYQSKFSRFLKAFGEFLFSIIWLLHIIIIYYENNNFKDNIIEDDYVYAYNKIASIIMILIFSYNFIFFLEFIYSMIKLIIQSISPRVQQKDQQKIIMNVKNLKQSNKSGILTQTYLETDKVKQINVDQSFKKVERKQLTTIN